MENTKDPKDKSGFKSGSWKAQETAWTITGDLWQSSLHIRDKATEYLEKFNQEPDAKYQRRKNNSVFINEFRETIERFGGMIFKDNPAGSDVPKQIAELFDDVDGCGNDFHSFLLDSFCRYLRDGNGFFLIDAPPMGEAAKMAKDEGRKPTALDRVGDRPFMLFREAKQVINHQYVKMGGREVLSQVTIEEKTCESAGGFGEMEVIRHRILRIGSFEVRRFEKSEDVDKDVYTIESEGNTGLTFIPLVNIEEFGNAPALLVLALLNILHYNKTSDFDDWCHLACVPERIYQYASKDDAEAAKSNGTVSPGISRRMWGEHSKAYFNEVSGNGIQIARERYQDIDNQMAKIGAGMMMPTELVEKTATEVADVAGQRQSKLAKYARSFSNAVEKSLYIIGEYINVIQGSGTVNLSDAEKQTLKLQLPYSKLSFSIEQLNFYKQMVDSHSLSLQTFLEWLQMSFEMPEGFSVETELERLKAEKPKEGELPPPMALNK